MTTKVNELMRKIHNNSKLVEARMPLILSEESENNWLKPIGNIPEASEEFVYKKPE